MEWNWNGTELLNPRRARTRRRSQRKILRPRRRRWIVGIEQEK